MFSTVQVVCLSTVKSQVILGWAVTPVLTNQKQSSCNIKLWGNCRKLFNWTNSRFKERLARDSSILKVPNLKKKNPTPSFRPRSKTTPSRHVFMCNECTGGVSRKVGHSGQINKLSGIITVLQQPFPNVCLFPPKLLIYWLLPKC